MLIVKGTTYYDSSNILDIISFSLPLVNQVGCDRIRYELLPNSSTLIFKLSKISIFSFTFINSLLGSSIMMGIRGVMVLPLGWASK